MKYNKIGIICAMKNEAETIRSQMTDCVEETIGNQVFCKGQIGKREVVLAVCGIGKVFAAMCAQTLILIYKPDCILNSGVAGSLSPRLDILSLAVGEKLVQHDMDTSPLGDPVGLISGLNLVYLPADAALTDAILHHAKEKGIPALGGTIASGDQFIATKEQKEIICSRFSPIACEMEGAAIGQVCFAQGVPFGVIRAISDSFDGQNEMDYALFADKAAKQGADFLVSLIKSDTL
jgi:adenosylhomocysteine nucleosidase